MIKKNILDIEEVNKWWRKQMINSYIKSIKDDVIFILAFSGFTYLSVLLFFFTNLEFFKILNLINAGLSFCFFIRNTKRLMKDLDELANIEQAY